uniref:SRCR domain-containing protein n=1 Tax=Macrostomum lignano TaxID=282301 RepID=A0A1I8FFE4_9PLAT
VCRSSGSSDLTACSTAAQLRSVAAAQDAAVAIRDETRTRVVLANRPPQFLRVNGSNSVGVTFSVTDPDGASPNVTVLEAVGGTRELEAGASGSWQLVCGSPSTTGEATSNCSWGGGGRGRSRHGVDSRPDKGDEEDGRVDDRCGSGVFKVGRWSVHGEHSIIIASVGCRDVTGASVGPAQLSNATIQ